jgi:hypothetical protein
MLVPVEVDLVQAQLQTRGISTCVARASVVRERPFSARRIPVSGGRHALRLKPKHFWQTDGRLLAVPAMVVCINPIGMSGAPVRVIHRKMRDGHHKIREVGCFACLAILPLLCQVLIETCERLQEGRWR